MIEGLSFNDYLKSKLNDNLMTKLRINILLDYKLI